MQFITGRNWLIFTQHLYNNYSDLPNRSNTINKEKMGINSFTCLKRIPGKHWFMQLFNFYLFRVTNGHFQNNECLLFQGQSSTVRSITVGIYKTFYRYLRSRLKTSTAHVPLHTATHQAWTLLESQPHKSEVSWPLPWLHDYLSFMKSIICEARSSHIILEKVTIAKK